MVGTLIGSARKSGIFKNDKGENIEYDNIILYLSIPVETYKTENSEFSGYPVTVAEVKIKSRDYAKIVNIPYDDVKNKYGETVEVFYDMVPHNGSMITRLSNVSF